MAERSLSPSTARGKSITDKQIDKFKEVLGAVLRKYRKAFRSDDVQLVLGRPDLTKRLLEVIVSTIKQLALEAVNTITCEVRPDYNRTPQEVLDATGRTQYIFEEIVDEMPGHGSQIAKLRFVNLGKYISDSDLALEAVRRGARRLATPYELAAANEADPALADNHPNATHWKNAEGDWCYIAFRAIGDERSVNVTDANSGWSASWWFAFAY